MCEEVIIFVITLSEKKIKVTTVTLNTKWESIFIKQSFQKLNLYNRELLYPMKPLH